MAEVTPSKQQPDERFQNRIANYRKRHVERSIKLQGALEASVKLDQDLTLSLQQKVLQQNKDKRSVKKKLDNAGNNSGLNYFQKRREDENEPPTKINKQEGNMSKPSVAPTFSTDLVLGLEHSSSESNLPISSTSIVKPLNSFKNDVEDEKPLSESIQSVNSLPIMNSSSASNNVNFKQEQRDYFPEVDLHPSMNFEFNELTQDAFASLLNEYFSDENKDSLFNQNNQIPSHQSAQQPRPQQIIEQQSSPHNILHAQSQQDPSQSGSLRHSNSAASFHQGQIKLEDMNENNVVKTPSISNQQLLPFHQQQQRQLHQISQPQHLQQQNPTNQQMQLFKQQQQQQQTHSHPQHSSFQQSSHLHSSPVQSHLSHIPQISQTSQSSISQRPQSTPAQFQQMQQQQMRFQPPMGQRPKLMSIQRPQPPEYNLNVRSNNNTQFTNMHNNLTQRLPQQNHQNTSFINGAMIRPQNNNVNPINRPFSTELMIMSQQRGNCQQPNMQVNGMTNWRNNMVTSQTRHSQPQPFGSNNYMQSQGVTMHGHNMNITPNQMHQVPIRSALVSDVQKPNLSSQNSNYRISGHPNNMPAMQIMKNNTGSTASPGYNSMAINSTMQMSNVLPNHMNRGGVNVNQAFLNNRNSGLSSNPVNTANSMGNCNANDISQISDFSFFDRQWNDEELMNILQ